MVPLYGPRLSLPTTTSNPLRKGNITFTHPDGIIQIFENGNEVEMIFRCNLDSHDTMKVTLEGDTIDFEVTEYDNTSTVCLSLADARRLTTHINSLLSEALG